MKNVACAKKHTLNKIANFSLFRFTFIGLVSKPKNERQAAKNDSVVAVW